MALTWLIHTRMGDPFYLGLRSFSQEAPLLAFMLIGGAAADRIDRRLILLSSQGFQMAMAALLGCSTSPTGSGSPRSSRSRSPPA